MSGAVSLWCSICLFVFALGVVRETVAERNLCEVCECLPTREESSSINCNCQKNKILIFNEEDADVLTNAKVLNISSCTFVSFPPTGFPKVKKLKSVHIRQINGLLHLSAATFPNATSLVVDEINELVIENIGQRNLVSVEIKNLKVNEIGEDALKEAKSLEKLIFQNVTINTIASNSFNLMNSSPKLSVKFLNSKIDSIHENGISLHVNRFEMVNTVINGISSAGMNITASDSVDIVRCTFGGKLSESFVIYTNKMNILENEFKVLPTHMLRDVRLYNDKNKINFISNTIYDVDMGGFILLEAVYRLNFTKNKILCDCSPRKMSVLRKPNSYPPLDAMLQNIFESNSCKNFNGITLIEFKRKFLPVWDCNATEVTQEETEHEQSELLRQSDTEISPSNNSVSLSYYSYYYTFTLIYVVLNVLFSYAR